MLIKLYCIGDSHVSVFLGKDRLAPLYPEKEKSILHDVEVVRLEGILAYNLCEYNRTTKGREKLEAELARIPKQSWVLISAGEVDVRVHLIKQAEKQNKTFEEVADALTRRYIGFLSTFKHDYNLIILLPPPSSYLDEDTIDPSYPRYSSETKRNQMTLVLTNLLASECMKEDIKCVHIYSKSTTRLYKTKKRYLWDGIHLSTYAFPYLLKQVNEQTNLNLKIPFGWWCKEYVRRVKNSIIK